MTADGGVRWARFACFMAASVMVPAGALALVVLTCFHVIAEQRDHIDRSATLLAELKATQAARQATLDLDPALVERASSRFLQAPSGNLLHAELMTLLRKGIETHGVTFNSVAPLPDHEWFGRKLVGVRVELTAEMAKVASFMSGIESGREFLFIRRARFTATSDTSGSDEVTAILEIYSPTLWQTS